MILIFNHVKIPKRFHAFFHRPCELTHIHMCTYTHVQTYTYSHAYTYTNASTYHEMSEEEIYQAEEQKNILDVYKNSNQLSNMQFATIHSTLTQYFCKQIVTCECMRCVNTAICKPCLKSFPMSGGGGDVTCRHYHITDHCWC